MPISLTLLCCFAAFFGWRAFELPRNESADPSLAPAAFTPLTVKPLSLIGSSAFLRNPVEFTKRVFHEITIGADYLPSVVTREVTLPPIPGVTSRIPYYIPLVYSERGKPVDKLSVHTADGTPISIVASSVSSALTYQLLITLTKDLFKRADIDIDGYSDDLEILRFPIVADASVNHSEASLSASRQALRRLFRLPTPCGDSEAWLNDRESILLLWEAALYSYIVFGEVVDVPGTPVAVTTSYLKPVRAIGAREELEDFDSYGDALFKDHLRAVLGVRPYVLRLILQYERAAVSYHLRVTGPDDQYVSQTHVFRRRLPSDNPDDPLEPAHVVVANTNDTSTLSYTHIYIRPLRDVSSSGELRLRIGMRERPPGLLGLVAIVSVIQLVMQITILGWYTPIFRDSHLLTDMPALLLASPAVFSFWLTNQIVPGRLQRMALSAVGGLAYNGVSAFIAALLALLASSGVEPGAVKIGHLTVAHPEWVILIVLSSWVAGNLTMRWAQGTWIFVRRLRRGHIVERYAV